MNKDFNERVVEQRKRLVGSTEALLERVEKSPYGPKTKAILREDVTSEDAGTIGFSLFDCPPAFVEGKGAIVKDADGKEYIDMLAGFGVSNVGLGHPRVVKAIKEQADKLIHYFEFPTDQRARLASRLKEIAPGKFEKKVLFATTGSEINDLVLKLARWYTGAQFILAPYGGYYGISSGTMGVTGKGGMWAYYYPNLPVTGVGNFPYAYCYRCALDMEYPSCKMQCVKYLYNLFRSKESPFAEPKKRICNVAAMIVEPMQSSAGYIIPPDEYMLALKKFCDEFRILFICDEIQAGMGRTGKMWGIDHSGVEPDIITTAKALADGVPIAAAIGRKEIMDSWGSGSHVSTFGACALASAAANAVLDVFAEENIVNQSLVKGKYFTAVLLDLQKKHPIIGQVQTKGLYTGIEFVRDRKTKESADVETSFITEECVKEGLLFEKGGYYYNRIQLIPPLIISKEQLDVATTIIDRVLTKTEKQFNIR